MASEIESQFTDWYNTSGTEELALLLNENGKATFVFKEEEFDIHYPQDFPNSSTKLSLSTKSKILQDWVEKVNKEIIEPNPPTLSLQELLTKAIALKKSETKKSTTKKSSSSSKKKTKKTSKKNFEMFSDGLEIDEEELELLKMKKRWKQKEEEIRTQMKQEQMLKKKDSKEKRVEEQQIFTSKAASGVLTNDLLAIMKDSKKLGYSAEPIDDNIYQWKVLMFGFKPESNIAKDLKNLKNKWGYDYVEFDITFKIDLYPFYPPLVRVIRPRFQGFMMGRIVSMEALKLDHWSPAKDMCYYLNMIRQLLEDFGRVDVNMPMNDREKFPNGSYTELEWLLLQLELLSDQSPRANLKYQLKQPEKESAAVTKSTVSTKETKKEGDNKKKNQPEYWAKGTGYGYEGAAGTGEWSIEAYLAAQRERDEQHEAVIRKIYDCLRKENKVSEEEKKSRFLILEESSLIPVLEYFLNNDSFLDMSKHQSLYTALFNVVRALAENDDLVPLLATLPYQKKSVYELLNHLHQQAVVYLKTVEKGKSTTDDTLVQNIEATFSLVDKALQSFRQQNEERKKKFDESTNVNNTNQTTKSVDPEKQKREEETKLYCEIMKQYQFDYVDLSSGKKYQHYYKSNAGNFKSSKERVLRLAQETGTLATSLPLNLESSIFVRVDEERMDLMTCMIIGPEKTPYSGGCFLFDIFFPQDYPNVPPNVWLMTTGNGTVRFNPNLYNNGKVCLSLLGTWSGAEGENWNKETSTLLQVLVSIQSLILVPDPYFNEPGYERMMHTEEGKKRSREYNENIYEQTIRHAMIGQLRHPPYGYEDVVRAHFYLRKDAIFGEINKAISEAAKRGSHGYKSRLESLLKDLKEEISKLKKPVPKQNQP